jgi:DNA-3-methyladenine glycosylase II
MTEGLSTSLEYFWHLLMDNTLTQSTYEDGLAELATRDKDLAAVVLKWGEPPFWTHAPGLPGIVLAILSQQVSLESAQAAFTKLEAEISPIGAAAFLSLNDTKLREIGFSRQKASYVRSIAQAMIAGDLDFGVLETLDDDQVRQKLMGIKGVGRWTADTYLLFALRRPDAWPSGDLALAKSIQEVKGLAGIPGFDEVDRIAYGWRPWRAVAARILWHSYLSKRGR